MATDVTDRSHYEHVNNTNWSLEYMLYNGCYTGPPQEIVPQVDVRFQYILHEIVVPVVFAVILLLGVFGNGLVLYVIISSRTMRTPLNVLLFNLALGDFCFLLFCVPLTAYHYATPSWNLGPHICRIWQYPFFVAFYVNMYTLVYISIWRYLTVVHGQRTIGFRTVRVATVSAAMVWLVMAVANIPTLLTFEVKQELDPCAGSYVYCGSVDLERTKILYLCLSVIGYIIPLVGLCGLNIALLQFVKQHTFHARQGSKKENGTDNVNKRTQKLTRTIVVVIGAFCTCWLPLHVHMIYGFYGDINVTSSKPYLVYRVFAQCLAYSNSCMNPLIYQITSPDFRKHFTEIFMKCGYHKKPEVSSQTATTRTELHPLNKGKNGEAL